jgi:soluble lytic murein transglycosylase
VRLAKARAALASGKPADAALALEKLDDELPLLRDLVRRVRAEAMFQVGPYDKAADYFGSRHDATSLALAAEALDKSGDAVKAKAAWDRVVSAERRSHAQEEHARYRRMQIVRLKDGDAAAAGDARWLATSTVDDKVFSDAADVLEKLTPPKLLTAGELLARSHVLAEAGKADESLRNIERATTRGTLPAIDVCRARAEAYYKARSRYPEAALAYRTCSAMGGEHAPEDLLLSARAFSRADRDADAIPVFQSVIQRFPRTTWADQAEFFLARIHALAGRWKEAATAFDEYVAHWPTGKDRREAARYRALAHLIVGDTKKARKLLEDLAGGAEDPITSARWTNLAALAALRDGDKLHALARWAEVARSQPLTYPALVARARILENGGTIPPTIEPAETAKVDPLAIDLPPPADLLHRIGFDAEAEAELRWREGAVLAQAPSRGTDALCAAYGLVDRAKRRYQVSLQIPVTTLATAPGPKNRGAWECAFPRPYERVVRDATKRARISADLAWAVMRQESAFDPDVVSPAHAVGLMQLLPETARATATAASLAYDETHLTSPPENVTLGTLYLRELLGKLGEKELLAVAAYNAGPEAIERWLARTKIDTLDVFVEAIPFIETRGYVVRVLGNLARYGFLDRGDAGVPAVALAVK